jgi:hypothetical protein
MSETRTVYPQIPWIKSPNGVFEVYANSMHVTWSLDDVRVRLGQVVDSPETPNPGAKFVGAIEERAAVTVSWREAKILLNQLRAVILSYESVNGPINLDVKLPPSM